MTSKNRLDLSKPEFGIRAQNFLNLMNAPEFKQKFLEDPGGVAAKELDLKGIKRSTISNANILIHRLLSDENFNKWSEDFQRRIEAEFPTIQDIESLEDVANFVKAKENKIKLMEEFSETAVAHLAPDSFREFVDQSLVNKGLIRAEPDIAVVPLTFIAVIVVIVIAAGYGRPSERLSRMSLQITINQLTPEQQQMIKELKA